MHRVRHLAVLAAFFLILPSAATGSPYRDLLERSDTLVTVTFVLKVKMDGARSNESPEDRAPEQVIQPTLPRPPCRLSDGHLHAPPPGRRWQR